MALENPEELRRKLQKGMKESDEREQAIRDAAKPLHELVETYAFEVTGVVIENRATSVSPASELVFGSRSVSYDAGYRVTTTIEVEAGDCPIEKLTFNGYSAVRPGDTIVAKVAIHEEHAFPIPERSYRQTSKVYTPRKPGEQETAIELAIEQEAGRRVERAIDYSRYEPPKSQ